MLTKFRNAVKKFSSVSSVSSEQHHFPMTYQVYIIFSQSRNIFYAGITTNIHKRLQYHNNTADGFTSVGRPWKVLWSTNKSSKKEAEVLEKKIKNLSRARKIEFIKKYHTEIHDFQLFNSIMD